MPQNNSYYSIQHIRLIHFHNFDYSEIDIPDDGHLFLLGDNGSGKTTVLDAVHYIITAGNNMEFNSAARAAGSRKSSGRRIQGIVTRLNPESGRPPLRPKGGVSYAGIEIKGRHGKITSVVLGLACDSLEGKIDRWGVIKECPMDEIPLLITEEDGKKRPSNRHELKAGLNGSGFHSRIGSFEKEIANRFFGGESTYKDICKLLSTGKAYREIAAKSSDYHELFRQLLQEPDHDVFNQVIEALQSIEASKVELESLQRKVEFLSELKQAHYDVDKHRLIAALMEWQDLDLALKETWLAHDNAAEFLGAEKGRIQGLVKQSEKLALDIKEKNAQLASLENSDSEGLVEKERMANIELKKAVWEQDESLAKRVDSYERLDAANDSLEKSRDTLKKSAQNLNGKLQKLALKLELNFSAFSNALDDLVRGDEPEVISNDLPYSDTIPQIENKARDLDREDNQLAQQIKENNIQRIELEKEIELKEKEGEATPNIEGFTTLRKHCRENLLDSFPLYEGLIPAPGIKGVELVALEQLIGENILSTWLVPPSEADKLRTLIFVDYPSLSLAVLDPEESDENADWLHKYFNYSESDPRALITLQRALVSAHGPHISKFLDYKILNFQGREQRVLNDSSRLIGAEIRKRALEKELKLLREKLKACEKGLKAYEKEKATLLEQSKLALECKELVSNWQVAAPKMSEAAWLSLNSVSSITSECEANDYDCTRSEEVFMSKKGIHDALRVRLQSSGLEGLDRQLKKLGKAIDGVNKEKKSVDIETGKVENQIEAHTKFCAQRQDEITRLNNEKKGREASLHKLANSGLSPVVIAKEKLNIKLPELRYLAKEQQSDAIEKAAFCRANIVNLIKSLDGRPFDFSYDETDNLLTDRRSQTLEDVIDNTNKSNNEQQGIINEKTQHLFKRIVMHDLIDALQIRILRLEQMSNKIRKLLGQRQFGSNRYSFKAKPLDKFKQLYLLIKNYNALDPDEAANELKQLIDFHEQEIVSTGFDEIPELLDYRNWFHYELSVKTQDGSDLEMNHRIKSTGSGGEQAVPNYLLILTIAHFIFDAQKIKLPILLLDEAFYGIDSQRRDQILGFASDLSLQLLVASPDLDGARAEIPNSTTILVVKDENLDIHLYDYIWKHERQQELLEENSDKVEFGEELS